MRNYYGHVFDPGWQNNPGHWIAVVWGLWALSWFAAEMWSRQTAARASFAQEAPYRIVTLIGVLMLFGFLDQGAFGHGWEVTESEAWVSLALIAAGFAFTWWARLHLGALWSGTITRKEGHRIIDSGPYAIVRHPIYTGVLLAMFATAACRGRWEGVIGAALCALGFWMKARQEEKFLSETLGPDYAAYRRRVHMLVPYLL